MGAAAAGARAEMTPAGAGAPAAAGGRPAATPSAGSAATPTAGSTPAAPSGGASGAPSAGAPAVPSGADAGTSDPPAEGGSGIPCDVYKALARACHRCHGPVPTNGAPMELVKIEDFRVLSVQNKPKIPKSELALLRMNGSRNPPMPPTNSPITDEDKKTLIDWLSAGAPEATSNEGPCE
ncbi:MAG TPA: hypothetical protein VJR89_14345 [Polyangiales bacterium]|nr:hypothetical protein [Polyangiales bacterium]